MATWVARAVAVGIKSKVGVAVLAGLFGPQGGLPRGQASGSEQAMGAGAPHPLWRDSRRGALPAPRAMALPAYLLVFGNTGDDPRGLIGARPPHQRRRHVGQPPPAVL